MQSPEERKVEPNNRAAVKTVLYGLLALILMGVTAGASYWWRDKTAKAFEKQQATTISSLQQSNASLEKQLVDQRAMNTKTVADQTACAKAPSATMIDNIKASITSGNTAALEGYMAPSVSIVTAGSGVPSAETPTQAVIGITNFISSDAASWDYNFALSSLTLSSYSKGSYGQYFPSIAVVGKATNKKVISFSFDCNAKINTVLLAPSEDLLK